MLMIREFHSLLLKFLCYTTHPPLKDIFSFIMAKFTGSYTQTSAQKYDEFLSKLGVNFMLRKAATISTPKMDITENDGKWKMVTSTTLKSYSLEFELVKF